MYVCLCNAVTDRQISHALRSGGCQDIEDVSRELGVGTGCGGCLAYTEALIEDHRGGQATSIRADTDLFHPA